MYIYIYIIFYFIYIYIYLLIEEALNYPLDFKLINANLPA